MAPYELWRSTCMLCQHTTQNSRGCCDREPEANRRIDDGVFSNTIILVSSKVESSDLHDDHEISDRITSLDPRIRRWFCVRTACNFARFAPVIVYPPHNNYRTLNSPKMLKFGYIFHEPIDFLMLIFLLHLFRNALSLNSSKPHILLDIFHPLQAYSTVFYLRLLSIARTPTSGLRQRQTVPEGACMFQGRI